MHQTQWMPLSLRGDIRVNNVISSIAGDSLGVRVVDLLIIFYQQ